MKQKFSGTFDGLKNRLQSLEGDWVDVGESQKQFRHKNGGILNWYSNGTIYFQGPKDGLTTLVSEVQKLLQPTSPQGHQRDQTQAPSTGEQSLLKVQTEACPPSFLHSGFAKSELIIGLVGAVGTELSQVCTILNDRLKVIGYEVEQIRISKDVIPLVSGQRNLEGLDEFQRISEMMTAGDEAREKSEDNSILSLGAAACIGMKRRIEGGDPQHMPRHAYIINSLKHPDEVVRLRQIYPQGFYLLGVHSDNERRLKFLQEEKRITEENAKELIQRDSDEQILHGQRVTDTFHMSDFFVRLEGDEDKLKQSIWRLLHILFGHPYITPTFQEYAMFLAFAASLRSADLSRQVGAVVTQGYEVISTGANDCPKAGGGLYWPVFVEENKTIADQANGRDYMRGTDANKAEQSQIIEEILKCEALDGLDKVRIRTALESSRIRDITEFGRVVHAEMEALISCARNNQTTRGGVLYCTTFPCHNCAKHIVAAGIRSVVYIEPYPKSKAAMLHEDSIRIGFAENHASGGDDPKTEKVQFEPFVGVGPRRFFDFFSMRFGSGYPLKRKNDNGDVLDWKPERAKLRIQMLPCSYLDLEVNASDLFNKARTKMANV